MNAIVAVAFGRAVPDPASTALATIAASAARTAAPLFIC
jgi:hypothetical protein